MKESCAALMPVGKLHRILEPMLAGKVPIGPDRKCMTLWHSKYKKTARSGRISYVLTIAGALKQK